MTKGYAGYKKPTNPTKGEIWEDLMKEFPEIQKAAYEAKYAAQAIEQMIKADHGMLLAMQEMLIPLIEILRKKAIITTEEMDKAIQDFVETKKEDNDKAFNIKFGYENVDEILQEGNIAVVQYDLFQDDKPAYMNAQTVISMNGKSVLPNCFNEIKGLKPGDTKEYKTTEPIKLENFDSQSKETVVKLKLVKVKKKVVNAPEKEQG